MITTINEFNLLNENKNKIKSDKINIERLTKIAIGLNMVHSDGVIVWFNTETNKIYISHPDSHMLGSDEEIKSHIYNEVSKNIDYDDFDIEIDAEWQPTDKNIIQLK